MLVQAPWAMSLPLLRVIQVDGDSINEGLIVGLTFRRGCGQRLPLCLVPFH